MRAKAALGPAFARFLRGATAVAAAGDPAGGSPAGAAADMAAAAVALGLAAVAASDAAERGSRSYARFRPAAANANAHATAVKGERKTAAGPLRELAAP